MHRNTDDMHYTHDWGVNVKIYTASTAAIELGTDGRTLRRFLRTEDSGFQPVGSGGSYSFSTSDMPKLRSGFDKWNKRPAKTNAKSNSRGESLIEDRPGLTHAQAKDPALVRKITTERVNRLEAALRASGKHISQMKDREGWAPRVKTTA